jgi:hypothetical protein
MSEPLIIEYTNLLHKHRDVNAAPVKQFLADHAADEVFVRRAKALNKVFALKEALVTSDQRSKR